MRPALDAGPAAAGRASVRRGVVRAVTVVIVNFGGADATWKWLKK
jgi:hypothetical protein